VNLKIDTNVPEEHNASIFKDEDADSMFLQNVGIYLSVYIARLPRRPTSIT
jgi:hypothetical protein